MERDATATEDKRTKTQERGDVYRYLWAQLSSKFHREEGLKVKPPRAGKDLPMSSSKARSESPLAFEEKLRRTVESPSISRKEALTSPLMSTEKMLLMSKVPVERNRKPRRDGATFSARLTEKSSPATVTNSLSNHKNFDFQWALMPKLSYCIN